MKFLIILSLLLLPRVALSEPPIIWSGDFAKSLAVEGFEHDSGRQIRDCGIIDPTSGAGLAAPVGSFCQYSDGTNGTLYVKSGVANTAWSNALTGASGWALAGNVGTGGTGILGTTDNQPFEVRANNQNVFTVLNTHRGISANPSILPVDATGVNQFDYRVFVDPTASTTGASHTGVYSQLTWDNGNAGFSNASGSLQASSSSFINNGSGTINYASTNANSAGFNNNSVTTQFKGVTSENNISSGATVSDYYGLVSGLNTTGGIVPNSSSVSAYTNFTDATIGQANGITQNMTLSGTTANSQGVTGVNTYTQLNDTATMTNSIQGFSAGVDLNDDAVSNGVIGLNSYFNIRDDADAGYLQGLNIGMNQEDNSVATSSTGLNVNMQYADASIGGNVSNVSLYTRTLGTVSLDSLNIIAANPELEGNSTIDNVTGLAMTPQIRQNAAVDNITGGQFNPQLSGSATAINMMGLDVSPQVNGSATLTNSLTAINVNPQSTVGLSGATALNVSMNSLTLDPAAVAAGAKKIGLGINDGAVEINFPYTIPTAAGFFQQHYMGGNAIVASGAPVSSFGFGTNLAQTVTLGDDWTIDPSGLGYVNVGFVGALNFDAGTTMARWTGALGGAGNPGGAGTLTDASMFRAAGILPQGGSLAVTNMYGFQVDPNLFCIIGTNCWGIFENTAAAENHLSKLAIGTSTQKVANSSTALEIGNSKAFLNGRGTTATKNALTAVQGMQFYDTTLNELQTYDGASWVSTGGGGTTPLYIPEIATIGANEGARTENDAGTPTAIIGYGESAIFSIPPDSAMYFNDIAEKPLFAFSKAVSSGTSGTINFLSGFADSGANSGDINIFSGYVTAGAGDSGNVIISSGLVDSGNRGNVFLEAPNISLDGNVQMPSYANGFAYFDVSGNISSSPVNSVNQNINQVAHGLVVGDVIRYNGTAYVEADASADATAEVYGIVSAVEDVDNFTVTTSGLVTGLSGLTSGVAHYLSETAGALTATAPTTNGTVNKPVFLAVSTTAGYVTIQRGFVNGGSGGGGSTVFSANITCSATPTINYQSSPSWISNVSTNSSGNCDVTLTGSPFSSGNYVCTANREVSNTLHSLSIRTKSTTDFRIQGVEYDGTGAIFSGSYVADITCVEP